jgi:hypothetical protein
MLAKRQWRATDGGVFGLDFAAVLPVARALGVTVDGEFMARICAYEDESLLQFRKDEKACSEEEREYCRRQFGDANFAWACGQCRDMKRKKESRHG